MTQQYVSAVAVAAMPEFRESTNLTVTLVDRYLIGQRTETHPC